MQNMLETILVILVPGFPLLGWAIIGLNGRRLKEPVAGWIASVMVTASFIAGILLTMMISQSEMPVRYVYGRWISTGGFTIPFGLQVDQLSIVMILVVSGVAALIHLYSIKYMENDPGFSRYFSYLNLFTGFMLLLVLADNFLLMFVGWEGVGLCSYLLIGFWFTKHDAIQAGKKAFLVNRVGDFAFLIGMILLATSPLALEPESFNRTLTYEVIFGNLKNLLENDPNYLATLLPLISVITILLFIGATGKSAQIPLHVWLPDAMEGPTPVSALIHAATMVTAGVYLVCRAHPLYLFSPTTMAIIVAIGALTAFFAATIALVQRDIKRTLAYSTISQIGFMFMGAGAGAFFAAIFHLMTHAFFKACLFLGSGSVIHATSEQNMKHLGGLKKFMPATYITFLIATATIAGFPLLSAFFSKDTILHENFILPFAFGWNIFAGILGYLTAILTAFYAFRLFYKTFEGEYKGPPDSHPHESPSLMTIPLWILAGLSVIAGFAGLPLKNLNAIKTYLDPVFMHATHASLEFWGFHEQHLPPWMFMVISVFTFLGGWLTARSIYLAYPDLNERLKRRFFVLYRILHEKYWIDEFYQAIFIKPGTWLFGVLWRSVDEAFIDKNLVEGTGRVTNRLGEIISPFQNGYIRTYALYILFGIIGLIWLAVG